MSCETHGYDHKQALLTALLTVGEELLTLGSEEGYAIGPEGAVAPITLTLPPRGKDLLALPGGPAPDARPHVFVLEARIFPADGRPTMPDLWAMLLAQLQAIRAGDPAPGKLSGSRDAEAKAGWQRG